MSEKDSNRLARLTLNGAHTVFLPSLHPSFLPPAKTLRAGGVLISGASVCGAVQRKTEG